MRKTCHNERVLRVAMLVLVVSAIARPVHAYCRTTTAKPTKEEVLKLQCVTRGIPVYWTERDLRFAFNPSYPSHDLDEATVRDAVEQAFDPWLSTPCDDEAPGFSLTLDAEAASEDAPRHVLHRPNVNVILFETPERWAELHTHDDLAFALTSVWFDTITGRMLGADLEVNEERGPFTICPDEGCSPIDGGTDLLNVLTHEAGHVLGLAHVDTPDSTMYYTAEPWQTDKRTLAADDEAGFCAAAATDAAPPAGHRKHTRGCSVSAPAAHEAHTAGLVLFAAVVFVARRRARSSRPASTAWRRA